MLNTYDHVLQAHVTAAISMGELPHLLNAIRRLDLSTLEKTAKITDVNQRSSTIRSKDELLAFIATQAVPTNKYGTSGTIHLQKVYDFLEVVIPVAESGELGAELRNLVSTISESELKDIIRTVISFESRIDSNDSITVITRDRSEFQGIYQYGSYMGRYAARALGESPSTSGPLRVAPHSRVPFWGNPLIDTLLFLYCLADYYRTYRSIESRMTQSQRTSYEFGDLVYGIHNLGAGDFLSVLKGEEPSSLRDQSAHARSYHLKLKGIMS